MNDQHGRLILLGLPVGNVGDLTTRVKEALLKGKYFAVEDTRRFMNLLDDLSINHSEKVFQAFHDHSDQKQIDQFLRILKNNDLYIASDAGSAVLSDPALPLIQAAINAGFEIDSYSGVSSVVYAIELCGFPNQPVSFHGFFPRDKGKQVAMVENLNKGLHLFFESPQRIKKSMKTIFAEKKDSDQIKALKELSKVHQSIYAIQDLADLDLIDERGEFVLAIYREVENQLNSSKLSDLATQVYEKGNRPKLVAKLIGEILKRPSKEVYEKIQ